MDWNKNKKGSIFELKNSELRVNIHKYVGCGDTLYLSCPPLNITSYNLNTEDFGEAVKAAQRIIFQKAEMIYAAATDFANDCSTNKFC